MKPLKNGLSHLNFWYEHRKLWKRVCGGVTRSCKKLSRGARCSMKKLTGEWVRKAENAIAAARQLFKQKPLLPDEIGFHCQQAIEKYFKAFLVEQGIPIKKTHDLVFL